MSAADDAYRAAQALIAQSQKEGLFRLDLGTPKFHALTRLPPELFQMSSLSVLVLGNTQISELSSLTALPRLKKLYLFGTPISNFSPLSEITGLSLLYLHGTQISDLSPLIALNRLKKLYLGATRIADLSPLSALSGLNVLDLGGTRVNDLSPLSVLSRLTELHLESTQISDLTPLSALTRLVKLDLDNTRITDLTPISGLTRLSRLSLDHTPVTDLSPLSALFKLSKLSVVSGKATDLSPLAALPGLTQLHLNGTQITDLTPLTSLKSLRRLSIDHTPAADLRPLCALSALVESPMFTGLSFWNNAATRIDPNIAETAKITNPARRARELFAYLESWVPPGEGAPPPKPDPLFETVLIDGQLELAPDLPTQAERDEALKRALHSRMRTTAPDLARAAGNHFPRLASKARTLTTLVEKPFDDLDLLAIHFEVETLHSRLELGTEEGVAFPDDVLGPLSDVTRTGPGLTLGHPSVDTYLQRVREARTNPLPEEDEATHRALSDAIAQDTDANGPSSRAVEVRIAAQEDAAKRQAAWKQKHKWIAWILPSMGHLSNAITVGGFATGVVAVYGGPISAFIATNAALLWEVALTYGPGFSTWFAAVMAPIYAELGVATEVIQRMRKHR